MFNISSETKEFYELNRKKIKNLYIQSCIIGLILGAFFFFVIWIQNIAIIFKIFYSFFILLFIFVLFPILVILEFFSAFWKEQKNFKYIETKLPTDMLKKLGFNKRIIIKNQKDFKKYVLTSEIDNYTLLSYPNNKHIIIFEIICNMKEYPTWAKISEFKSKGYNLDNYSISTGINIKHEIKSVQQIESAIREMIILLKMNNYTPLRINEDGEY
jgi:hypothetical protein